MTYLRLALISLLFVSLSSLAAAQEHPQSYTLSFPGYPAAKVQLVERAEGLMIEVSDPHGHTYEARAHVEQRDGFRVLQSEPLRFLPRERKAGFSQALGGASTFPGAPRLNEGPLSHRRLYLELREGQTTAIRAALQDIRQPGVEPGTAAVDWSAEVDRLEEAAALRGDLETQAELKRAKEQLERERAAEAESGDLERVRATTTQLRDELSAIAAEVDADPAAQVGGDALRRRVDRVKGALGRAIKARDELEQAEIESKDAERIGHVTQGLQTRLAELRGRLAKLPPASREARVLRRDADKTAALLENALREREAAELALVESKDLDQVDQGLELARTRLAELRERLLSLRPDDPEAMILAQDRDRSAGLLGQALKKREAAEVAALVSKDPAQIGAAVDRIRDRVADLSHRARQERLETPAGRLLREDRDRSQALLRHAYRKQEDAELKAVESKRPERIQATTDLLQDRLYALEDRLHRIPMGDPRRDLLQSEAESTRARLGYAGRKQLAADRLEIESKNLLLINQAGKRLSERRARLEKLERQTRAAGALTPTWLSDRLLETEALQRLAREARAAQRAQR